MRTHLTGNLLTHKLYQMRRGAINDHEPEMKKQKIHANKLSTIIPASFYN